MNCPICSSSLVKAGHEGILHYRCPDGHGHFFPNDSLGEAVRSKVEDRSDAEEKAALDAAGTVDMKQVSATEAPRSCPSCHEEMTKLNYAYESGVVVDTCREHGAWLDAGELERIESWFEGNERISEEEMAMWQARLDVMEKEFDRTSADQAGDVHWGPLDWIVTRAHRWWYARDDRENRRAG